MSHPDRARLSRTSRLSARHAFAVVLLLPAAACFAGGTPSNDLCNNPLELELGENPFTTIGATVSGPSACVAIGADVWFNFNSTFNGQLLLSTCGDAGFDTVIAAYSGCGCGAFTSLGCNDDGNGCTGDTSKLTITVKADTCYRIRLGGFNGASGTGTLTLSVVDSQNAAGADRVLTGADAGDRFGWSVSTGGHINNDSFDDVIVGGFLNDTLGLDTGRTYVHRGATLNSLYTFTGGAAGDHFGQSVAHADVNDDGRDDVIIGAPNQDGTGANAGHVYVYSGFNGSLLWDRNGFAAGDRFGFSVAAAGDVNNDGFDDVIVGAPYNDAGGADAGRAYVLDGEDGSVLRTVTGQAAGDLFGYAVSGATDLNDDGKDDFMVGAPRNDAKGTDAGRVTIFSGGSGSSLLKLNGDAAGDRFGSSLAGTKFTSTYDYSFLAIGSPNNDAAGSNAGRVKVYFRNKDIPGELGCTKLVCVRYTVNGGNPGDKFGTSVALGQITGNNAVEIVVGAPTADLNGLASGAVYIFNGATGALVEKFYGEANGDYFGQSVAIAGDVNDDGDEDLIVGAPYNDAGGTKAGRAYLFFLSDGVSGLMVAPPLGGENAADLNGDGQLTSADMTILLASWAACEPGACSADLNGDGHVNMDDLLKLLSKLPA